MTALENFFKIIIAFVQIKRYSSSHATQTSSGLHTAGML